MKRLAWPRAVFTMKPRGETLKTEIVHTIAGFFFLYVIVIGKPIIAVEQGIAQSP